MRKLLAVQAAALGADFARRNGMERVAGMEMQSVPSAFPAVTCVASAGFRTAAGPESHGVRANGWLDRKLLEPCFWKQPAGIVRGPRIWDGYRARGGTVAVGFVQQSLGERADAVVSPAPIHKHGGGMVMDCYSSPRKFYETLRAGNGKDFTLLDYWGPLASPRSSEWIARGFAHYLASPGAAGFVWAYLPCLDYDLQRFGPDSPQAARSAAALKGQMEMLADAARSAGYETLFFGDYAVEAVSAGVSFPNRLLRRAGLFSVRMVRGMAYHDFHTSAAFAVCDHQIAEVELFDPSAAAKARACVESDPLVASVEDVSDASGARLRIVARQGAWFAYPWWDDPREAPEFAGHVDIHAKPGFDPCELFFARFNPFRVSQDASKVRGTHGRAALPCAFYSSAVHGVSGPFEELARAVRAFMDGGGR